MASSEFHSSSPSYPSATDPTDLPKDQLQFLTARLACGDIMILSHIRVSWHAGLAPLSLTGSAPQMRALGLITVKHIREGPAFGGRDMFVRNFVRENSFGPLSHIVCFNAALT